MIYRAGECQGAKKNEEKDEKTEAVIDDFRFLFYSLRVHKENRPFCVTTSRNFRCQETEKLTRVVSRSFPTDCIRSPLSPLNQQPPNLVQSHESVPLRFHRNGAVTIVLSLSLP